MSEQRFTWPGWSCGVGDVIQTALSDGKTLRASLDTHEAAAYGSELVLSGRWEKVDRKESDEREATD